MVYLLVPLIEFIAILGTNPILFFLSIENIIPISSKVSSSLEIRYTFDVILDYEIPNIKRNQHTPTVAVIRRLKGTNIYLQ